MEGFKAVANSLNQQHRGTTVFSQFMNPFCQLTGSTAPAHVSEDHSAPSREGVRQPEGAGTEPPPARAAQSEQSVTIHSVEAAVGAKRRSSRPEGHGQSGKRQRARKEGALQQVNTNRANGTGELPYQVTSNKIRSRSQPRPRPTPNFDTKSGQRREGRAEESPPRNQQENVKSPKRDGIIAFFV